MREHPRDGVDRFAIGKSFAERHQALACAQDLVTIARDAGDHGRLEERRRRVRDDSAKLSLDRANGFVDVGPQLVHREAGE